MNALRYGRPAQTLQKSYLVPQMPCVDRIQGQPAPSWASYEAASGQEATASTAWKGGGIEDRNRCGDDADWTAQIRASMRVHLEALLNRIVHGNHGIVWTSRKQ